MPMFYNVEHGFIFDQNEFTVKRVAEKDCLAEEKEGAALRPDKRKKDNLYRLSSA